MKADRIASIAFILMGIVLWSQTGELQYNGMIFPRLLIIFLMILSAVMLGQTYVIKDSKRTKMTKEDMKYIIMSIVSVFIWVYLLDILGFIVSSVLVLSILTALLDLERLKPARILFSVAAYTALVFVCWLVFHSFLLVPLPTGFLI